MEIAVLIVTVLGLLVWVVTLMVSATTIFGFTANISRYIVVIDDNFVSRASGNRKLYESTLKAWQTVDPECFQKYADKEDEEEMSQCPLLFSKQVDAWHINNFWFVKHIIKKHLDKYDKQIEAA